MNSLLFEKKILLIVTGGIAAYKSPYIVRLLVKHGSHVKVVQTESSKEFVTSLTLSTLSKNKVYSSFTQHDSDGNKSWNNHVELSHWADYILVAPATSSTISKIVNAQVDNLAMAIICSSKCPVFIAPSMDLEMYVQKGNTKNISKLKEFGMEIIPAKHGELASGLIGQGRMEEPENIVDYMEGYIRNRSPLFEKTVLITAGPTYENIDPVRYIGNYSTGKMGFALAEEAAKMGANVVIISGPSSLSTIRKSIRLERVVSAIEMQKKVNKYYLESDITIAAAAVADYRPKKPAYNKIKKKEELVLHLVKNPDILKDLGKNKTHQFLVGFALETNDEVKNARNKLINKNLDLIVLNSLNDKGSGFGTKTNKVTLISPDNTTKNIPLKLKQQVAKDILTFIIEKMG